MFFEINQIIYQIKPLSKKYINLKNIVIHYFGFYLDLKNRIIFKNSNFTVIIYPTGNIIIYCIKNKSINFNYFYNFSIRLIKLIIEPNCFKDINFFIPSNFGKKYYKINNIFATIHSSKNAWLFGWTFLKEFYQTASENQQNCIRRYIIILEGKHKIILNTFYKKKNANFFCDSLEAFKIFSNWYKNLN